MATSATSICLYFEKKRAFGDYFNSAASTANASIEVDGAKFTDWLSKTGQNLHGIVQKHSKWSSNYQPIKKFRNIFNYFGNFLEA